MGFLARLNSLVKRTILAQDRNQPLQGLKPNIDIVGFFGTTEVMPCYKAIWTCVGFSFSPGCEVVALCTFTWRQGFSVHAGRASSHIYVNLGL